MKERKLLWYLSNGDVIEDYDAYKYLKTKMNAYENVIDKMILNWLNV